MITVTATQHVRPGMEAKLDRLMAGLRADVLANEPGCLCFDYVQSDADPQVRLVYEQYRDYAAFQQHRHTEYLAAFIPELMECLTEPPRVQTYGGLWEPTLPPSFFHIGWVVPDLDEAIAYYNRTLGIEFTEQATFDIPRLEDPDPHPFKMTAAFSRTEPPYYELIQADGDGILSADRIGEILYYSIWEPDMDARLARLRSEGSPIDAVFRAEENSTPFAIITGPDRYGTRIEYVGTKDVQAITEWVSTGRYPGGIGG
jgi:quinol monooxygenase YgiN/catechol 2,3-dioxygenase-like lactoylglutathione lyase family enzyme